tara:strand:- start:236 stop:814 length:579 start_codon:yes stop_codon:yes gene_type:complete
MKKNVNESQITMIRELPVLRSFSVRVNLGGRTGVEVIDRRHHKDQVANRWEMQMQRLMIATVLALLVPLQASAMDSLSQLTWKNRIALVFGAAGEARLERQLAEFTRSDAALADRDMVVVRVTEETAQAVYGSIGNLDAAELRRQADIAPGEFQVVLIGKDGGAKLKSGEFVDSEALFGLIDRMPMRRAEQD